MNLENSIKDVISKKLNDGIVEKLIGEQLENGIKKSLESLLGSYGDINKVIEKQIKSVMIPYLEAYDYSQYIIKLDSILMDVLKSASFDNQNILKNFKNLMTVDEEIKSIKVSELFNIWGKYVAEQVETTGLEVDYECGAYELVEVSFEVEKDGHRSWSSFEYATLVFECEHDEKMNFSIRLSRWNESKDKNWDISYKTNHDLSSLRHLNEFEITLMKLGQNGAKLEMDEEWGNDEITPNKEPEASYS